LLWETYEKVLGCEFVKFRADFRQFLERDRERERERGTCKQGGKTSVLGLLFIGEGKGKPLLRCFLSSSHEIWVISLI
jgi:hypothetical protein